VIFYVNDPTNEFVYEKLKAFEYRSHKQYKTIQARHIQHFNRINTNFNKTFLMFEDVTHIPISSLRVVEADPDFVSEQKKTLDQAWLEWLAYIFMS